MQIPTDGILVNPGRREVDPDHVSKLAESIKELGLLNPITIDKEHTLIAGLHRLEAVKLLGWLEVECTVSSLEGLQAELAEIDENFVRNDLSTFEYGEMLLRRKEIYETLHPETRRGMRNGQTSKTEVTSVLETKSFAQDTAGQLGVAPRTIERKIQMAKNLIPAAKEIVKEHEIGFEHALKLSRLEPEQQQEAATLLATKEIKSVDEYKAAKAVPAKVAELAVPKDDDPKVNLPKEIIPSVPNFLPKERCSSFKEVVAELKNTDKDFSCTPDSFLAEFTAFVRKYLREIEWYNNPYIEAVFPCLSLEQLTYLQQQMDSIGTVNQNLLNQIERKMKT